jgi:NitT/TauT family transport system substrate-binding protein
MRGLLVAGSLCVLSLAAAGCGGGGSEGASDSSTIRIAGNTNAAALPVWVAQDKGYFKDCGSDVDYTVVQNITTLPAALGKSFDVALSVPPLLISAASQGVPIAEVAGATLNTPENPQTFLVAPTGSDIDSVEDLAGKTLGVQTITGSTHLGTMLALKRAGVPLDSVKVVEVDGPAQADQLKAGRVDAVETLAPFSTSVLKLGTSIIDPQSAIAPTISGIFWTASPDWAKEHSDQLDCFREGLQKAADYIGSNEADAKTALEEHADLPADVVEQTQLPTYTTEVRPEDLDKWLAAMKEVGGFTGDVDSASLVMTDEAAK